MASPDFSRVTDPVPPPAEPARTHRAPAAPRRVRLTALAVGAAVAVLAYLFAPAQSAPATGFAGDEALAADVERLLGDRIVEVQGLSVARFDLEDPGSVEWAAARDADGGVPVDEHTPVETGSVFKVVTGMLLADMVERGETSPDRTLAEIFPDAGFADPEVASITLRELATHHSGLGAVPDGDGLGVTLASLSLTGPYERATPPLEGLAGTRAGAKDQYVYSNLGFAVLGHALAAEAGTTYPDLARERVLDPLGMDDTVIAEEGTPEGAAPSHYEPGVRVAPWSAADYAPAGVATWSTVSDLVALTSAVADGSAPGADAAEIVSEDVSIGGAPSGDEPAGETGAAGSLSMGLAWHRMDSPEHAPVTFHNGKVYGASSMVAFDGERAVVLLGNTMTLQETALAMGLMDDERGEPLTTPPLTVPMSVLTAFLLVVPPLLLLALVARRRTLVTQRPIDRLRVVSLTLGNLAWLAYLQRAGVWTELPTGLFALSAGAVAAAVTVGVWHWRRVPVEAGRFRWLHVTVFVLSVLFSLGLVTLMTWGITAAWS
ncbi:serine hydrolase domain-containing protein [Nocardiopsis ganjiahuensis]|uniref:serine hydrolase domain-containing protein n=1 Tax=Nocardiopsis ganjiahuensis TaxID=239984 RepID=UPI000347D4A9|nr:serine hydrolase domain-containing protein [Nocardiopsis ganjiahuensis]